ncbi:hypothetical protein [Candidatus Enterococcus clewellii]|uniref:Peptidase M50 domain-containing protein n=1 Tax=Candidatus Enterococcus clewellii TaxID=1834193 RepID=A0A242KE73_9ENTE|nr:hypothetical protein [Enterococcus sp. 9E7_DIV0242]OTP19369.1 hypothetical protein A5888_001186 [Enterococcus sp. 9E7_DIV0242]
MKKVIKQLANILLMAIIGGVFGYFLGKTLSRGEVTTLTFIQLFLFLILWFIVQIFIHEAGHAVFGLLTGYKMVSFRLFSFMWVWQENGKIVFRRHKVLGTLGQCLMAPPPYKNGHFPFRLYLMGGVLANLIFSVVIGVLFTPNSLSAMIFVTVGLFFAVTNGIPMGFNDGATLRMASSSQEQAFLFYLQMDANYQFSLGKTHIDLPEKYFETVPAIPKRTYFNDYQTFLQLGLLFEQRDLAGYEELLEEMWERQDELLPIYQIELKKTMLMWLCTQESDDEWIPQLWQDKSVKASLKQPLMGNRALEAAYYGFVEGDYERAEMLLDQGKALYEKAPNLASAKLGLDEIEWLEQLLEESFQQEENTLIE